MPCSKLPRSFVVSALSLAPVVWVGTATAHIDLKEPPMRGGDQKAGPCEGRERGTPMEFEAGSTITVSWEETINHEGYFLISFDPDGDDFDGDGDGNMDYPASVNGGDEPSGNGDLVLMQVDDTGGSMFSAEVTLPNIACDNCTLQLMQNMGERTPMPNNATAHLYFRCTDIVLVGGEGGGSGGQGSGGQSAGSGGMVQLGGGSGDTSTGGMAVDLMGGNGGMMVMPPAGRGGSGLVPPGQPILPVDPIPPTRGGQSAMGAAGTGQDAAPPPTTTTSSPATTPTVVASPGTPSSAAPSPSASGTAPATTDDGSSESEGGCFGTVSPRPREGHVPGWALLAAAVLGLGRLRRRRY